jgi:hypothetical protein
MNAHRPQKCLIDMSLTFGTKKVLTSKVRIYIYPIHMHLIIFLIQKKVKFTKKNSSIITGGCNSEFQIIELFRWI